MTNAQIKTLDDLTSRKVSPMRIYREPPFPDQLSSVILLVSLMARKSNQCEFDAIIIPITFYDLSKLFKSFKKFCHIPTVGLKLYRVVSATDGQIFTFCFDCEYLLLWHRQSESKGEDDKSVKKKSVE